MRRFSCGRYFIAPHSKPFSRAFVHTIGSFLFERGEEVFRSCHIPLSTFFVFEFVVVFYLMNTCDDGNDSPDLRLRTGKDLSTLELTLLYGDCIRS